MEESMQTGSMVFTKYYTYLTYHIYRSLGMISCVIWPALLCCSDMGVQVIY